MKFIKIIAVVASLMLLTSCDARGEVPFEEHWLFARTDDDSSYLPNFDDSSWRSLDLPHDWAFEEGYSEEGAQGEPGGYANGGIAWYRKHFNRTRKSLDKRSYLEFDAVYMNSEVWINGHYLGKRPYGYISFEYEVTDYLVPGENVVAVRVDNSLEPSARWYHGCGIYGGVRLTVKPTVHLEHNSIYVTTPQISSESALVSFKAQVNAPSTVDCTDYPVYWEIISPDGGMVLCSGQCTAAELAGGVQATVPAPRLWSPETPVLYTLCIGLGKEHGSGYREQVPFGIRSVSWDPETGFHLNGSVVKLQGVCEHLEGGPVGAAWTKDLLRWKLQLIKDMGCNAIRTAHNPQLPFFYDLCDEMGIMVMDECFDGWLKKAPFDYGMQAFDQWWERDLRDFVRRDRNHPSVIIYSVGNETRGDVAADLVRVCHEEDPSRLVTSGHSGTDFMDVMGINGNSEKRSFITGYKPGKKAFVGTETPHTWQTRGYYRTKTWYRDGFPNKRQDPFFIPDLTPDEIFNYEWASPEKCANSKQHFNSSYDNATVRLTARHNIEFLRDSSWYSGSFRWTGFDYLGEAGYVHGGWPFRAFMGGALDMAGFKKDLYYLYQSEWTSRPMVHILPHWTHPYMKPGTEIPVVVYTNADNVELRVNGKSLGKKTKGQSWSEMALQWMVPWTEGKIEAIASRNGEVVARAEQVTSAQPSSLGIEVSDITVTDRKNRTLVMTLTENDKDGVLYPYGENRIHFHFPENVRVLSLENGNPVDVETNANAHSKEAFFGLLRGFFTVPAEDQIAEVLVGAILGDKRLEISHEVSIAVNPIDLISGKTVQEDLEIHYTTDGTTPTRTSPLYRRSFEIQGPACVRAVVFLKKEAVLEMSEQFGPNEGIFWNTSFQEYSDALAVQVETLTHSGFQKTYGKAGAQGDACLLAVEAESTLGFYQENDGSQKRVPLKLRMMGNGRNAVQVFNNDQLVGEKKMDGRPDKEWRILDFMVPLTNGANQILIKMKDSEGCVVDWIEMNE